MSHASRPCVFGILTLFFVAAGIANTTRPDAKTTESGRAVALINVALNAQRKIPAYSTTTYLIRGADVCTVRSYVANGPGRVRHKRTEITISLATKPVSTEAFITNARGVWKITNGQSVAVEREPALVRPIPRRLATAETLGIEDDIPVYTIEPGITYFGMPASKVTVSLSEAVIEQLGRDPTPMKKALRTGTEAPIDPETFEKTWLMRSKAQFPSAYVYYIHSETPFVLAWQAYSLSGEMVAEVAHQEFKIMDALPGSLFEPPKASPVLADSSK
jgi:hypothetical protein